VSRRVYEEIPRSRSQSEFLCPLGRGAAGRRALLGGSAVRLSWFTACRARVWSEC
jgi:hypothetical protein